MTLTVNGVTLPSEAIEREAQRYAEAPDPEAAARRSLAVRALLLQRARELGLADEHPGPDAEDAIIGRVLDAEVRTPTPGEMECRRYFDMHSDPFTSGKLVEARHILFAVTPGTPVAALRAREGIAAYLSSRVQERALMQYIRVLAGRANIEGVDLDAAASPLLQ